jgi:hypothetical protein
MTGMDAFLLRTDPLADKPGQQRASGVQAFDHRPLLRRHQPRAHRPRDTQRVMHPLSR